MFKKVETKQAEGSSSLTVQELAQKVKDNAARVELQRKELYCKRAALQEKLQNPVPRAPEKVKSFDLKSIEKRAESSENYDDIIEKIRAIDEALDQPPCCDHEYLESIREYLEAVRPAVKKLESEEWDKLRALAAAMQQCQKLTDEYYGTHNEINKILHVAHLSIPSFGYDKMGAVCGKFAASAGTSSLVEYVDDALGYCDDGNKYNILARMSTYVSL